MFDKVFDAVSYSRIKSNIYFLDDRITLTFAKDPIKEVMSANYSLHTLGIANIDLRFTLNNAPWFVTFNYRIILPAVDAIIVQYFLKH